VSSLKDNSREMEAQLRKEMGNRLERAAILLQDKLKQAVSVAPGEIKRYGKKGVYFKGVPASNPGDPPHKVTGSLRASIAYDMGADRQSVKIGTSEAVGAYLETGTTKMAARPWLRPTLASCWSAIQKIIGG
jgi:hypothetical protein